MNERRRWLTAVTLAGALALLAGCGGSPAKSGASSRAAPWSSTQPSGDAQPSRSAPQQKPSKLTINDPCPARLHDLCGPLLLYWATNYRLPETVEELQKLAGFESVGPYACPVSKEPYVYNPNGLIGPNIAQRAVIYDAAPTHSGYRWAIAVEAPTGNAPLIAKVVAWPESRFPKNLEK